MKLNTLAIGALAVITSACAAPGFPPPPPVPIPPLDPNSEAFQKNLAKDLAAGVKRAATQPSVSRRFIVVWDMHYGYGLRLPEDTNQLVTPDFTDDAIVSRFDNFHRSGMAHLGERLICDCVGVEWSFNETRRFLVRDATITWVRGAPDQP